MKRIPLLETLKRTPWFLLEREGPPARTGVFETTAVPLGEHVKNTTYRNYLGGSMWAEAQATPGLAVQCTSAVQGNPIFWRGLKEEA